MYCVHRIQISILALAALTLASNQTARAQTSTAVDHGTHGATLPIAINGAQTPERISDTLAYRHLIIVAAQRQKATAADAAVRNDLTRRLGLIQEDKIRFLSALTN